MELKQDLYCLIKMKKEKNLMQVAMPLTYGVATSELSLLKT